MTLLKSFSGLYKHPAVLPSICRLITSQASRAMSLESKLASLNTDDEITKLSNPVGSDSTQQLLEKLEESRVQTNKKGRVKKSTFKTWIDPSVMVDGWKFNEWDYGNPKINLPIEARGLFTQNGRIVIRGYDKFFNVGEVASTKWDNIERNTTGPYYLSLKENGCIVFMSGLVDGTLLITSKHSTGPREQGTNDENHSYVATKWIQRHLEQKGIAKSRLARELYNLDVTAVAELCDDDFEEHVLAYKGDTAGIYIHGLNRNTAKFATHSCEDVAKFSEKYGFFKTQFLSKQTMPELKQFLDECAETGSWNGNEVEGFVVRCKLNGDDFFFKYKFTEPYLMYRDWREVTKKYLSNTARKDIRITRHVPATNRYLDYVIPILESDKQLGERYLNNHGIIDLRDRFLQHIGQKGIELASEYDPQESQPVGPLKYCIMPASVLGCGKTTIGSALAHLTGWGHVQNDELTCGSKSKKFELVKQCAHHLDTKDCVILDRNNHQFRERDQAIRDMLKYKNNIKFVCLNFWPDTVSKDELWKVTRSRITQRGDNHSTIHSSEMSEQEVNGIARGFMSRFEPVATSREPDSMFDTVIDIDVRDGSRANLEKVVNTLHENYPELIPVFTKERLDEAMQVGMNYQAKQLNEPAQQPAPKKAKVSYFNVSVSDPTGLVSLVDKFYAANPQIDSTFWTLLKSNNNVNSAFHVTLAHVAGKTKSEKNVHKTMSAAIGDVAAMAKGNHELEGQTANLTIQQIGHNNRIMALSVDVEGPVCGNSQPHITIGYVTGTRAVESNQMLSNPSSIIHDWNIEPRMLSDQKVCAFV